MSWESVAPPPARDGLGPVTVAIGNIGAGARTQRLKIMVRTDLLPECSFFRVGNGCRVLIGEGDHQGLLRIEPGSEFSITTAGGKVKTNAVLFMLVPRGDVGRHNPVNVEFDYDEQWIELTLPEWARPAKAPKMAVKFRKAA